MISIKYSTIKKFALIYISLPLICFFIGWLRWYYAVLSCVAVIVCLVLAFLKDKEEDENSIKISYAFLITVFLLAFGYCLFCGIGRLWAQSKDYPWRNAIFRDIILRDWPVIYDKYQSALSYYIGIWLPPALLGKISLLIKNDTVLAFTIGNIGLLIYCTIGIVLVFLLIVKYLKPTKKYQFYLSLIMFVFFSGMDILGSIEPLGANNYHLEWWAVKYQYSSFTTCMCWVFNQAIIPWICMLLVLSEEKVCNYVIIGMCCLLSGPLPFVGLFIYCLSIGIKGLIKSIKEKKVKFFIRDVLSISNILSSFIVFPFIGLYLISNASFQGGGGVQLSNEAVNTVTVLNNSNTYSGLMELWNYLLFILAEFLVYMIIIFRKYKKNYLYYVTLVMLLVFPFGKIGYGSDFTMRASIPSLLFLYLLCTKYIFEECSVINDLKKNTVDKSNFMVVLKKYSYIAMIICLLLGAFTPAVEFIRGFRQVANRGINDIMTDYIISLGDENVLSLHQNEGETTFPNFVAMNYKDKVFFNYFSKTKE